MRKSNHLSIVFSLIGYMTLAGTAWAVDFELTADYFGKYIWRGQDLDNEPVFQPGLSAAFGPLSVSIWGSLELTDKTSHEGDFTEVDYSLDYSGEVPGIDLLGFSVGVIYYDFPNTGVDGTTELYWGFSTDVLLSPSLTVYHDVDEADGTYISASIEHSIKNIAGLDSGSPISLELGASIGWGNSNYNEFYWGITGSELNDLVLSASLPVDVAGWIITPSVNYVRLMSGDIRDTDAYGADDLFYAGISFAREF
jgi:hypothetical protein